NETILFKCDNSYNTFIEILKYLGTVFYLSIGFILHIFLMKTILISQKSFFKDNSYFQLHVVDSIASIVVTLNELFFFKLFTYLTPLCSIIGPFFWTPSINLNMVYISLNHARFSKSITQIFMVLNRMSCVLFPTAYNRIWRVMSSVSYLLILFLPCAGMWNVWISRIYLKSLRGGFTLGYEKTVKWAALSLFQSIFILTALAFTIVCSSITFFKLIFLPERIKPAEKSLCLTSIFISFTFVSVAITQV
ncbi:Protein CBG20982, partial [Caenorhabditis briggsae]